MGIDKYPNTGDNVPPLSGETAYAAVGHAELIEEFYVTEGDPVIGRELSCRLFAHADFPGDPTEVPLTGRDGNPIEQDGKPLKLADYVNYAVDHHFEAVEGILDFLMKDKGSPDYEAMRRAIAARLNTDQT